MLVVSTMAGVRCHGLSDLGSLGGGANVSCSEIVFFYPLAIFFGSCRAQIFTVPLETLVREKLLPVAPFPLNSLCYPGCVVFVGKLKYQFVCEVPLPPPRTITFRPLLKKKATKEKQQQARVSTEVAGLYTPTPLTPETYFPLSSHKADHICDPFKTPWRVCWSSQ